MALWVDRTYGAEGSRYVETQVRRLAGDDRGIAMWRSIGERLDQLRASAVSH